MAQDVRLSEAELDEVREILRNGFNPQDHQEAQELILGACQEVQHRFGWVSFEAARTIAEHLGVSENLIFGLLTFYADFRTEPPGNHFMLLCHGTACFVGGSQRLIDELKDRYGIGPDETTADGELTVQVVNGCLGVCDCAPLIQLDHVYHGKLTVDSFNETIAEAIKQGPARREHAAH